MPSCTQCGHRNPDDARFCSNCGAALRPGETPPGGGNETSTITISGGFDAGDLGEKGDGLSGADLAGFRSQLRNLLALPVGLPAAPGSAPVRNAP